MRIPRARAATCAGGLVFAGSAQAGVARKASHRPVPEPPRDEDLVYLYDGSLEGLLAAVFDAYARHENPGHVLSQAGAQVGLLSRLHEVRTDEARATRVKNGVVEQLGEVTLTDVKRVFLSDDPERGTVVYRFLRRGFAYGPAVRDDLAHPDVAAFARQSVAVGAECEKVRQFTRFRETSDNVWYARVSPKACVVPLVMGHFAARFGREPFVLYDAVHELAGLWDGREWALRRARGLTPPPVTAQEAEFARLWRTFYDAVGIKLRKNERLRRQLMPVRFWSDMTEFAPLR